MNLRIVIGCTLGLLALAGAADAQQRPLVTEDPETIGSGNVLVEAGADFDWDIFYPLSGLRGDLLRLPSLGASFGIGSIAELQVDGGFYQRLNVTGRETGPLTQYLDFTGDTTSDMLDLVVGTKVRLAGEGPGRPSIGLRVATKLPFAGRESGLATDSMDFFASVLIGKTVQSVRIVGNAGMGMLSDPVEGNQNNAMTYGLSFARAISPGAEIVGEVNGRWVTGNEGEAETANRAAMRFGGRYTRGTVRVDGGFIVGMTSRDPAFGVTGGITWVFRGFTIP